MRDASTPLEEARQGVLDALKSEQGLAGALARLELEAKAEAVIEQTKMMLLSGECPTCHHNVMVKEESVG